MKPRPGEHRIPLTPTYRGPNNRGPNTEESPMPGPATTPRSIPTADREPGLWADLAALLLTRIAAFERDGTLFPTRATAVTGVNRPCSWSLPGERR